MMSELLEAKRLAARLRRVRLERGLSLRGAAASIGVTKETLSDLERASRKPHPPTLAKIADGYGVEISDLLGPMVEELQAEEEPVYSGKAEAPSRSESPEKALEVELEESHQRKIVRAAGNAVVAAAIRRLKDLTERWESKPPKSKDEVLAMVHVGIGLMDDPSVLRAVESGDVNVRIRRQHLRNVLWNMQENAETLIRNADPKQRSTHLQVIEVGLEGIEGIAS